MNETDYELSWIEKIMGGKLTTVEKSFCQVLFLLLLVWPVAAIILFKTAFSGAEVLWVSNTIRLTMALFVLPYPIYLLPLLIFSRKIALHYKNPYLFYIIATVPFYIIICSNLLYISPLANARPKGADPLTYKDYGLMGGISSGYIMHLNLLKGLTLQHSRSWKRTLIMQQIKTTSIIEDMS